MSKRKLDAKAFAQQKRKRRQWITFLRMCRYGVNNFSRNAWLTIAATAVMTITLLIVFITLAARNVLVDTVAEIRNKVDMSIYVKTDISDKDVQAIQKGLQKLSTVKNVDYITPAQARADFAKREKANPGTLEALNQSTNKFPGTFRVKIVDINDTTQLKQFVDTNKTYKNNRDPDRDPSFAGQRKTAIAEIGGWASFAEKAGLIASIIFIVISSLIVFNTIRMAIFNRKDEIQMMKLIGADRSFIRGPFVVEAVVYGFIAAIIATGLGITILYSASPKLADKGIVIQQTLEFVTMYVAFVLLGMIILGAVVGIISSLLATRRYLRI